MHILTLADVKAIEKQMKGAGPTQALNPLELETRMVAKACEVDYETLLDLPRAKMAEYENELAEQLQAAGEMVHTGEGWQFTMAYPPNEGECCIYVRFPTRRDTVQAQHESNLTFIGKLLVAIAKVDGEKHTLGYWDKISYADFNAIAAVLWDYV